MGASINTGSSGGGRRRRVRSRVPMSEINVTPFVDVMLVLLIIFMVAAPLLTSGVPLELPQAKGKQLEAQETEPVVVSVTSDGKLFLGQEDKTHRSRRAGSQARGVAEARGGMDEPIFVRGDRAVEYGTVARVMARIKEAGFRKLSLVTEVESGG